MHREKHTFMWITSLKLNINHWFTTHLTNKSQISLSLCCSKTPYYSDENELQWVWCVELIAVISRNSLMIQARLTWADLPAHQDAHYSIWMAWVTRQYSGLWWMAKGPPILCSEWWYVWVRGRYRMQKVSGEQQDVSEYAHTRMEG